MADAKMISCCIITLGEPSLSKAIASARPHVDEVCVLYTGTDATWVPPPGVDRCEHTGWHDDFAFARNRSFAIASHRHVLWLDSDDELVGAGQHMRALVAECAENDWIALPYDYEHDLSGRCTNRHMVPRIVTRDSGRWEGRVHEQFVPNTKLMVHERWDVSVKHHRTAEGAAKSTARNLRILRGIEKPTPRELFFLGMSEFDAGNLGGSQKALARFLGGGGHTEAMRAMACLRMAMIHEAEGRLEPANAYAFAALSAQPWAECYVTIAHIFQAAKDWKKALHFAVQSDIGDLGTGRPMWGDATMTAFRGHALAAECAAELGMYRAAVGYAGEALEYIDDEDLKASVGEWEKKL